MAATDCILELKMCFHEPPHECKRQHTLIAFCRKLSLSKWKHSQCYFFQAEPNLFFSLSRRLGNTCDGAVEHLRFSTTTLCLTLSLHLSLAHFHSMGLWSVLCSLICEFVCLFYFIFLFLFGFMGVCLVASKGPVSSTTSSTSSSSSTSRAAGAGASQSPACQATHSLALPLAQGEQGPPPTLPPHPLSACPPPSILSHFHF